MKSLFCCLWHSGENLQVSNFPVCFFSALQFLCLIPQGWLQHRLSTMKKSLDFYSCLQPLKMCSMSLWFNALQGLALVIHEPKAACQMQQSQGIYRAEGEITSISASDFWSGRGIQLQEKKREFWLTHLSFIYRPSWVNAIFWIGAGGSGATPQNTEAGVHHCRVHSHTHSCLSLVMVRCFRLFVSTAFYGVLWA